MSLLRLPGLISAVAFPIHCFAKPQAPLRAGTSPWADYEPCCTAWEQGYFDKKPGAPAATEPAGTAVYALTTARQPCIDC